MPISKKMGFIYISAMVNSGSGPDRNTEPRKIFLFYSYNYKHLQY